MIRNYYFAITDVDSVALLDFREVALQQGYGFSTLAEASASEQEAIYWLHQECRKRQPPVETRQTPQDYGKWQETFASETAHPKLYSILHTGNSGIAVACLVKTDAPEFCCGFTGILSSYAGQGLALALKSHLLLTARQYDCPIRRIITSVRDDNLSMLRLNERLGFRPG